MSYLGLSQFYALWKKCQAFEAEFQNTAFFEPSQELVASGGSSACLTTVRKRGEGVEME